VVPNERAELQAPVVADDPRERKVVDVDDHARIREPVVQQRDEALTSREHLRVASVFTKERERFVESGGRSVLEAGRHSTCFRPCPYVRTPSRSAHTEMSSWGSAAATLR